MRVLYGGYSVKRLKIKRNLLTSKRKVLKPLRFQDFLWQRVKDSNPHIQSQSLLCYLYTNPLYLSSGVAVTNRYYYIEKVKNVKPYF